jgi:hypothetical protein
MGGEDYLRLGNLTPYYTRKWACDIMFWDYDSECNNFFCAIGNWWSGNKSGTWCGDRKSCVCYSVGATKINPGLHVPHVEDGSIIVVAT